MNHSEQHAETRREYRTVWLARIVANHFESGILHIPPYRSRSTMDRELMCADGAGPITKMLPTDDGVHIPTT